MFKAIKRNHKVFESELFMQDSLAFSVMESILNDEQRYPTPRIFSDEKNCAIVNSDSDRPVIVWTSDNFQKMKEVYDFVKQEFCTNNPFKIMSKKNFYDSLVQNHKIPELDIQTLGVYSCLKLNRVEYIGCPDNINSGEIEQVAQMISAFGKETGEDKNPQMINCVKTAHEYLSDPNCLVWRDEKSKIVAMAIVRENKDCPRIGRVYTLPEERGKSYAKMLVHYLTARTLKAGKKIMLFTNYDYEPSNRCYQAIGYELKTTIINFMPPLIY